MNLTDYIYSHTNIMLDCYSPIFFTAFKLKLSSLNMVFWSVVGVSSLFLLFICAVFVIVDLVIIAVIKIKKKGVDPLKKYRFSFMTIYLIAFLLLIVAVVETNITHDPSPIDWINTYILPNITQIGGWGAIPVIGYFAIFWYRANSALKYINDKEKGLPSELKIINNKLNDMDKSMTRFDNDLKNCKIEHKVK